MPRPRVKDEDRKRVARACDTCKRRKEKCDGGQPCLLCRRRTREDQCHYSEGKRGSLSQASVSSHTAVVPLNNSLGATDDAEIAIESLLTLSGNRSAARTPQINPSPAGSVPQAPSHAPVPKLARLLRDGHGKFIFVGDSSTLAFLQNVRRLVKTDIGECALTTDPKRHAMVEAIPTETSTAGMESYIRARPTRTEARELVQSYLNATSGVIDLFDQTDILSHLLAWTDDINAGSDSTSSIFYLVLAIGAENRPNSTEKQAALYFTRGRELAVSSFMDDPSLLTVQSYILIAFYMVTSCRRNGAFMLLGIAIRAAYALGLHRSDISVLFEARERKTRERVWKSLRVLDMFLSASLGRPPATSEVDGGNVSWKGTSRGYEDINLQALHSSAMLRICFIFERVLNEVYCRREVSVQLVDSISKQYRDWNLNLDAGLQNDGVNEGGPNETSEVQQVLGLAHLKGAYYWSIILLTRPFLIFDVSSRIQGSVDGEEQARSAETVTLSEACIDAALRSVEIASDVVHTPGYPRRPVLVTNSIFVSSLVIGLAILGNYDKSFPLLSSLDQVKIVLGELAKFDPAARRFSLISKYLQQAALEHVRRRDQKQLLKRRQGIQSIFGSMMNRDSLPETMETTPGPTQQSKESTDLSSVTPIQSESQDLPWPRRQDDDNFRRDMTITTSGVLASSARDSQSRGSDEVLNTIEPNIQLSTTARADERANVNLYGEEFPLFSLMNEFDSMNDSLFMEFS